MLIAYSQLLLYALTVVPGILLLLIALGLYSSSTNRKRGGRLLTIGAFGGLIMTSSIPWWLYYQFVPVDPRGFMMAGDTYLEQLFGYSPLFPSWLPRFFMGFWLAPIIVGAWSKLFNRVRKPAV
jgi:hypothetical protein